MVLCTPGATEEAFAQPVRPEPLAVTAERVERVEQPPKRSYRGNPYSFAGHRFPKDPGTLL